MARHKVPNLIEKATLYRSWNPVPPKFFAKVNNSFRLLEDPIYKVEKKGSIGQSANHLFRGSRGSRLYKKRSASTTGSNYYQNQLNTTCTKSLNTIKSMDSHKEQMGSHFGLPGRLITMRGKRRDEGRSRIKT
jgi:hypothetical protein